MCPLLKAGHKDKQDPIGAEQTPHYSATGEVDTHHIVTQWPSAFGLGTENPSRFGSLPHVHQISTWSLCRKPCRAGCRPQQPLHLDSCLSETAHLHGGPTTGACHYSTPGPLCMPCSSPRHSLKSLYSSQPFLDYAGFKNFPALPLHLASLSS